MFRLRSFFDKAIDPGNPNSNAGARLSRTSPFAAILGCCLLNFPIAGAEQDRTLRIDRPLRSVGIPGGRPPTVSPVGGQSDVDLSPPKSFETGLPFADSRSTPHPATACSGDFLEFQGKTALPPDLALQDLASPQDPLLMLGLERGAQRVSLDENLPLDWRDLDPALSVETVPLFTLQDDLRDWWPEFRSDLRSLFVWENALILGIGTGVSLGLREAADGEVRAWTASSPDRWGAGSQVLRQFGEFQWQVPTLLLGYSYSLWRQDEPLHNFFRSTISAYTVTSATTVAIKGIADTQRPSQEFEDGRFGFPSFHASSCFCIAANIETWYGWEAGLPAYALAGLVGWSRIDQREHDLSDVVFGSILGYTIGKSVALCRLSAAESRWRVNPWFDANQAASGVSFDFRY